MMVMQAGDKWSTHQRQVAPVAAADDAAHSVPSWTSSVCSHCAVLQMVLLHSVLLLAQHLLLLLLLLQVCIAVV
jgi:hypothetical protein